MSRGVALAFVLVCMVMGTAAGAVLGFLVVPEVPPGAVQTIEITIRGPGRNASPLSLTCREVKREAH